MASSLSGLSASVTRILYLTGFPKELKTKDIQSAFSEWENANGGFKIKWRDDTSLLIVFQDASVAKRAYLHTLAFPPAILTSSATGVSAAIRPYDGPDAQTVIQNVNSRGQHANNPSRGHNARAASISVLPSAHARVVSLSASHHPNLSNINTFRNSPQFPVPPHLNGGREPSPTLPSIPSHPTLNALINSSLSGAVTGGGASPPRDPAILATSLNPEGLLAGVGGGPRIGDPGKRMLGAALGVRHPGLPPRMANGSPVTGSTLNEGIDQTLRAMSGLTVAE